jgi:hypothetical protein
MWIHDAKEQQLTVSFCTILLAGARCSLAQHNNRASNCGFTCVISLTLHFGGETLRQISKQLFKGKFAILVPRFIVSVIPEQWIIGKLLYC